MPFIPKREHMKAGKCMGLSSSWHMEQWQYMCAYITGFNILSFQVTKFLFPLHSFACFSISSLSAQKTVNYYLNGNTKNQKHES